MTVKKKILYISDFWTLEALIIEYVKYQVGLDKTQKLSHLTGHRYHKSLNMMRGRMSVF